MYKYLMQHSLNQISGDKETAENHASVTRNPAELTMKRRPKTRIWRLGDIFGWRLPINVGERYRANLFIETNQ